MEIEVTVANTTREAFDMAFRLVFLDNKTYNRDTKEYESKCIGYNIVDNVLYLSKYSDKCTLFPYKFNVQQTTDFAWGWWENTQEPTEEEPDTDGSTEVAYEITTKKCGVGSSDWGMFASVRPVWFVYGK
jgi:hypothetical protein